MAGFGSGEYRVPFLKIEEARYQFLRSVRRLCPLPLFHLRDRIAPHYDRWVDEIIEDANARHEWEQSPEGLSRTESMFNSFKGIGMPDDAARKAAEGRPIRGLAPDDTIFNTFAVLQFENPRLDRVLKLWAQRNHLTHQRELEEDTVRPDVDPGEFVKLTLHKDYWACEWALFTLWFWKFATAGEVAKNAEPPEWITMSVGAPLTLDEPAFRVQPGWDVLAEEEGAFRKRAELALNAYIARKCEIAKASGLQRSDEKRRPSHFDWLALYQVSQWSYRQIAERENVRPGRRNIGEDTVRKGVRVAASLCRLNARLGSPGRPKIRK